MILFGLSLAIYEIVIWTLIALVMCMIAYTDRYDLKSSPGPKAWTLIAAGAFLVFSMWMKDFTFKEALNYAISQDGLMIIGSYFGIGVIYSFIEFLMVARKSKSKFAEFWSEVVKNNFDVQNVIASDVRNGRGRIFFINNVSSVSKDVKPTIEIDKPALAGWIWTWSVLWPFYAISLIIGDLLNMIFDVVAEVFVKFGKYITSFIFKDLFK